MRIYAVADIHGKSSRIERIGKYVSQCKPDAVVVAGDITNLRRAWKVISQLNELNLPVLAVRGNTDLPGVNNLLNKFSNTVCLHLKEHIIKGVQFVGIGGTIPLPFRSQLSFLEVRVLSKISRLVNHSSVLVAHPPPWRFLDQAFNRFHAGSKGLYRFIRRYQPRLLICGHIHEKPGTATIGKSMIVNCNMSRKNSGAIIEIAGNGTPVVEMI
jgi:Icc-related predicted phosphoesterase